MTSFRAQVIQDIPANRLVALAGIGSVENREYDKIYLKKSELGWIPDFVTNVDLEEGQEVDVVIKNNPIWNVEAAQRLPAGTLVMCDEEGRVKSYNPSQGNHIGYTTHEVEAGEVVSIVRKYGNMPQNQAEIMYFVTQSKESYSDLTVNELKQKLDEKGVEYKKNATKKELIELLEGD